jgi:hypothetical protein
MISVAITSSAFLTVVIVIDTLEPCPHLLANEECPHYASAGEPASLVMYSMSPANASSALA